MFPQPELRSIRALALGIALALPAAPGLAAEPPLTFPQAQRAAVERSRTLAGQRSAASAARDMAAAAGQFPDPVLSLSLENVPAQGPDRFTLTRDGMTMRRLGLMQELTRKEKRDLKAERYEIEARKMAVEGESMTAMVQRETALAWLDAWYADAIVEAVAELRARSLQEVEGAETEYRAGKGSQADVLMAHQSVAMLDDRAAEAQRKARNARAMLARWVGEDAGTRPLGEKPDMSGIIDTIGHAEALARHPQIEALDLARDMASAEARLASANRTPDWTVEFAWQDRRSRFGDMFSVGVSIPLPWDRANRQDRELAAKLALAEQAQAARDEALRQHTAEVRMMANEWQSNRSRVARYEREILPLARARFDAALVAYRAGKSTRTEVLAALRSQLDARLMALMLESETARLWAQLTYLIPENPK